MCWTDAGAPHTRKTGNEEGTGERKCLNSETHQGVNVNVGIQMKKVIDVSYTQCTEENVGRIQWRCNTKPIFKPRKSLLSATYNVILSMPEELHGNSMWLFHEF